MGSHLPRQKSRGRVLLSLAAAAALMFGPTALASASDSETAATIESKAPSTPVSTSSEASSESPAEGSDTISLPEDPQTGPVSSAEVFTTDVDTPETTSEESQTVEATEDSSETFVTTSQPTQESESVSSTTTTDQPVVSFKPSITQGGGCVSTTVTVPSEGAASDLSVYLDIYYGDPGNPFTGDPQTVNAPGVYSASLDISTLDPSFYDYPFTGIVSWTNNGVSGSDQVTLDTSCLNPQPTEIPVPAQPGVTDPPGPGNATWNVPNNDNQYTWELAPNGDLIVRPTQPNTTFPGGKTEHNYGQAPDSYVPPADDDQDGVPNDQDKCPGTPANSAVDANGCAPSQLDSDGDGVTDDKDKCPGTSSGFTVDGNGCIVCPEGTEPVYAEGNDGIVNDCRPVSTTQPTAPTTTSSGPTTSVSVPTDTSTPTNTSGGPTVTSQSTSSSNPSTPTGGMSAPQSPSNSGGPSTQPTSGNTGPVVVAVPVTPVINDPTGPANATWVKPIDGDSRIIWTLSEGDRHIVASLPEGYVFADGSTFIDFGIACDAEGEQLVVSSTSVGNPTPQPTGNGGEGMRASTGSGDGLRTIGLIGLMVAGAVGAILLLARRRSGEHS